MKVNFLVRTIELTAEEMRQASKGNIECAGVGCAVSANVFGFQRGYIRNIHRAWIHGQKRNVEISEKCLVGHCGNGRYCVECNTSALGV